MEELSGTSVNAVRMLSRISAFRDPSYGIIP